MHFPGVALVTGAASGIGEATALRLAKEGCQRIVIADVNVALLQGVEIALKMVCPSITVLSLPLDVREARSVQDLVDSTIRTFGRIDYCANVAGIVRFGDTVTTSLEDFEEVIRVNMHGVFLCCRAQITAMLQQQPLDNNDSPWRARGAIVNVASQAGLMGNGDLPAYVASKHGVVGLSKSDGLKFASRGIRVNALCPGTVETAILGALPQGEAGKAREAERRREIALGRVGQPDEIAQCVAFLLSGRSSFVTGTTLAAHGGLRL